jgi:addiction module HigA family antidote
MANLGYGFYATHPGEILKDELEARRLSPCKFAEQNGINPSALNDLLDGRCSLSGHFAQIFEKALGISAESLMKLQMKYDEQMDRK